MPARGHKIKHPLGKLLVTTALLLTSAGFAVWQKKPVPVIAAFPSTPMPTAAVDAPSGGIGAYEFHEGPAASAITMPSGSHVVDGEYISGPWDTGYGMVQVKVRIKNGAFTTADFLQVPFERARSNELSHFAKPLLLHEMIHEQKAKVDIISTATYTSFGFQDALAEVVTLATRR